MKTDANGVAMAELVYTPVNEKGDLRVYTAHLTKKTKRQVVPPRD